MQNLSKSEIKQLRNELKSENKNICFSEGCNGVIKPIEEFCKDKNKCKKCYQIFVKIPLKKVGRAYQREKIVNRDCDGIELLEFDHISKNKSFDICRCTLAKKIKEELPKTQFLCIWCHRLKTKDQINE